MPESTARTTCVTCRGPVARTVRSNGTLAPAPKYCRPACKPRCSVSGCAQPQRKRAWCATHYSQWHATGTAAPFKHKWGDVGQPCKLCGADVPRGSGKRAYCSNRCQVQAGRYPAGRPESYTCAQCGTSVNLLSKTAAGQFKRTDSRLCDECRHYHSRDAGLSPCDLAMRDGLACGICGDLVDLSRAWPDPFSASVDHRKARSLGGTHEPSNLQLAHLRCNSAKGASVT